MQLKCHALKPKRQHENTCDERPNLKLGRDALKLGWRLDKPVFLPLAQICRESVGFRGLPP
jgi:hypothetical protein